MIARLSEPEWSCARTSLGCIPARFARYPWQGSCQRVHSLPSLLRFLAIVAAIVALAYGAMVAVVSFVTPQPREMTYTIPAQRLNK